MKNHYEAFKVFERRLDGKLYSAGNMPEWLKLEYSETKFNFPKIKGSQLLVFTDEVSAIEFRVSTGLRMPMTGRFELWKVQCFNKPKRVVKLFRIWHHNIYSALKDKNNIIKFWKHEIQYPIDGVDMVGESMPNCHQTLGVKLIEKLTL